jgi:hypothetical protein
MDPELAHFSPWSMPRLTASIYCCISAARSVTCLSGPSPVTGRLRDLLAGQGVPLPPDARAASDPYALLRFILAARPGLAEAEICQQEILAAAAARSSPGLRNLLDGPAPVSIIGDVCPAAITGYWPACTGTRWTGYG